MVREDGGIDLEKEYHVGYIRTNCFNKVVGLFTDKIISALTCYRSRTDRQLEKSDYPWVKWSITGYGEFHLDWDMWKHKTSWEIVFKTIIDYKSTKFLSDFVVERIQVGFTYDKKLWDIINKSIPIKDMTRIKPVEEKNRVFLTFNSTALAYTNLILDGKANIVEKINNSAIQNLRFKKGVMDLKKVDIERDRNRFDSANFLVNKTSFIERALSRLNTHEWFKLPEIQVLADKPTPCAIRTYESEQETKWQFVKDKSINYENGDE